MGLGGLPASFCGREQRSDDLRLAGRTRWLATMARALPAWSRSTQRRSLSMRCRENSLMVKQIVLDTIGVVIGASGLAPEARIVAEYVEALGGRAESTVFGFGFKAPAPWAAFVNGSLGHMLDYDDVGAGGHIGIATVPVAFAVAEGLGRVSGRDLITAIAAGTDLHTLPDRPA